MAGFRVGISSQMYHHGSNSGSGSSLGRRIIEAVTTIGISMCTHPHAGWGHFLDGNEGASVSEFVLALESRHPPTPLILYTHHASVSPQLLLTTAGSHNYAAPEVGAVGVSAWVAYCVVVSSRSDLAVFTRVWMANALGAGGERLPWPTGRRVVVRGHPLRECACQSAGCCRVHVHAHCVGTRIQ